MSIFKYAMSASWLLLCLGIPADYFAGWPVSVVSIFMLATAGWGIGFVTLIWRKP